MTASEAEAVLEREVARRLERPLTLTHGERRFVVDPGLVRLRTNLDTLVPRALAESREGNFITRAYRDLTGGGVALDSSLRVTFDRDAVENVLAGIGRELDRPVREAESSVSFSGVEITPSRAGLAVRKPQLRDAVVAALTIPEEPRALEVPVRVLRPKVTTKELRERYGTVVAVSRSRTQLRLFVDGELAKTYRVGIGAAGFDTPAGEYEIESKAADPAWYVPNRPWAGDLAGKVIPAGDPRNPIKARWLGFWDGAGIHGTADDASIGTAASHGCVRMTVRDVKDLYERVPLHAPIFIS
ncbi:MAG TPA: L,D-transpeptidase/peptidoglycan binding protein [Gaiellaceae bacterium]|nr:L,D-transpeptidase/peptidoglycan binding protein [Gaiellaceae bacterium]